MRIASVVLVVLAAVGFAAGRSPVAAQTAEPHPLVGSWRVEVEVVAEGQPPLTLPNLASFTADGVVLVSAPSLLPELPGAGAPAELFGTGHGAWAATGEDRAEVVFAFLVVDERGEVASVNTVRGHLEVAADGDSYLGEFDLSIASAAGDERATASGTWRAARIAVGAAATPTAGG